MKVLLFNGSSHIHGNTYTALCEIANTLTEEGIESEILHIGSKPVNDCVACYRCSKTNKCVFNDDIVNQWVDKAKEADGFIFGTPVFFAHASGQILSVLDRLFYASGQAFTHKPGAGVAVGRRGGCSSALDDINKYFTINQMPIPGSTYWNMVYGAKAEEVKQDNEGMQTMRNLARNMAWLLKCIDAGKTKGIELPKVERTYRTNFIR